MQALYGSCGEVWGFRPVSLLSLVPGGSVIGRKKSVGSREGRPQEEIEERIINGLLPAQLEFCQDSDTKILGLVAGFGSGKTRALCAKAVLQAFANPGCVGAVFEPTNILLRDVWMRSFDEFLEEYEIEHDFRVSPQPEYTIHGPNGSCVVLCRATETWNRIRGQNLAWILCDEIDTSPHETSKKAVEMFLARLRGGSKPQLGMASTPEGYKILYQLFVEESEMPDRKLIRAKTTDNPYLPEGFVESLYANYEANLIASYINGEFTNLANTTVYHPFDRDQHWCDTEIQADDRVFVGVDFNVGACFCVLMVRRGEEFHVCEEAAPKDTPAVVEYLQERLAVNLAQNGVVVIPDASSRHRTTTNAAMSDLALLRKGGFTIKEQSSNPQIADRVNCVNVLLLNHRMKVNSNKTKYLTKSLETQAYSKDGKPEKGIGGLDDVSGPVDALGYAISYLSPLRRWRSGGSRIRTY